MVSSQHCVLIGGLNRIGCVPSIDDHIVQIARDHNYREHRQLKALHIGVCNGDAQKDEVEFDETYGRRGCAVSHARIWRNPEAMKNINSLELNIIYLSGGNPLASSEYERHAPKELSIYELLKKAHDAGVIVVGNSAGAIILGRYYTHLERDIESAKVYKTLSIVENAACFAHFEEYPREYGKKQGREVTPEEFLQTVHPVIKRKSRKKDLYTFGLWTDSALEISWTGEKSSQTCTARSIGEREVMYMNGNPKPSFVKR